MKVIVAGIGTEVGKTVVSAVLCQAFDLTYWKPVQAGSLDRTDADHIKELAPSVAVAPEAFSLKQPMSPHAAAAADGVSISLDRLQPPDGDRLLVELAGGLMVPLNSEECNIDLVVGLGFPTILVANYYLGSINHTLLSAEVLRQNKVDVLGIVFNGVPNQQSRNVILRQSGLELLFDVPETFPLGPEVIETYAKKIRNNPRLAQLR